MEKKLTIFERAIKNKEKLKLQLISLTLATTAIISTGCTPSEKPNFDDEKPGIEEISWSTRPCDRQRRYRGSWRN